MNVRPPDQVTVIPAQPGWYVLVPLDGPERGQVESFADVPVLAWVIEVGRKFKGTDSLGVSNLIPVCVEDEGEQEPLILRDPTGRIYAPYSRDFATREDARRYVQEERRKERPA